MMSRQRKLLAGLLFLVSLQCGLMGCAVLTAHQLHLSSPEHRVRVEKDVMVPMSDGVELATDIYFPREVEKAPVILIRTPYGKNKMGRGPESLERLLAQRGYIVVVQDVRGRYGSGGKFYPFVHEGKDGQETMAWIRGQPWFGGKLGTYGASYLGTTQWFSAPGEELAAMHLSVTSPNIKEVIYTGGELHLLTVYFWSVIMGEHEADEAAALRLAAGLNKYISTLPLGQADDAAGREVEYFHHALDPAKIWQIYQEVNFDPRYAQVSAPALFIAGWYDMFLGPQLQDFQRLLREGQGNASRSVLIVGPWGHGPGGDGSVRYGRQAAQKKAVGPKEALAWFDYWLKGVENDVPSWPRVRIFVMGDNVWREENEWPLARTVYTNYYLHSAGNANTRRGDGSLSPEPPGEEPPDRFTYNPLRPVPTRGGNNLGLNLGAYNQARVEDREDVLCYTTPVLEADLEVTGPIKAVLYAATDAVDTDFTVKLVDVYPDGKAVNIQDGIVRAYYRTNDPTQPVPLTPGAVERYEIDLWATSNVFKAGHRVRVEVSSSNFPRFNRNLNTGEPSLTAQESRPAHQAIYHDAAHPSHLILPIIPR